MLLHLKMDGVSEMENNWITDAPGRRDDRCALITLSGEIDVRCRTILEDTLRGCLAWRESTLVELSGVTFMDSRCVRELAFHYQLGGGRTVLYDPSEDVLVGAAACGLEDWLDFVHPADPRPLLAEVEASIPHCQRRT